MNYLGFKIALRNARKNGILSFAKLFGLCISSATILFATGYVYNETSFDRCIPDHDKIFRCVMQGILNGEDVDFAVTSPRMAGAIVHEIPEITEAVRVMNQGEHVIRYQDQNITKGKLIYADPKFFSFFSLPIQAHEENLLTAENHLVISKSLAEEQFGSAENAIDKVVNISGEDCIITGVFSDFPKTFHLQADLVQSLEKSNPDEVSWESQNYYTYFKTTTPDADRDALNFKLTKTVYTHSDTGGRIDGVNAKNMDDLRYTPEIYVFYNAEKLTDIHFSSHKFDPAVTSNKTYVYGAILLSLLVLLISSINFINLTVANISTRLKEMGIRKTTGAYSHHIVSQFLFESFVFWIVAFALAVLIYLLAGNALGQYLEIQLALTGKGLMNILAFTLGGLLLFNLAVNLFPILLASNRQTLSLIKDEKTARRKVSGNNAFVFMQFALSGFIILSSLIVQKQINYMVSKDRGYNSDNVMMVNLWGMNEQSRKSFIEEIKSSNPVQAVATSNVYFGDDPGMNGAFFESQDIEENFFHTSIIPVDEEFLNVFNMKMLEGRFFEKDRQSDFETIVLNETAAKEYPGKGSIIGKEVIIDNKAYHILGVVQDFNFRSLHHKIQPLVFTRTENQGNAFIKIKNSQIPAVITLLQEQWKKYNNSASQFSYTFHDDVVAKHYIKDQQAKKLLLLLSFISIAIACVGLYAISFFTIVRRTKEIGIRKVNGAKISELMGMLNMIFLKWVVLAFVVATPIVWYVMKIWLETFAYQTALSWWIFFSGGVLALCIALLTVSWQSWKAATRNPVEALRYE